jgi:hypothetical protein
VNTEFIRKLEVLAGKNKKKDADLLKATNIQIKMAKLWNDVLLHLLESESFPQGD